MKVQNSYFRQKHSKKGLALSTAMAICIVLAVLVALLVSMASLNINTTQATVSQREAYIQAKSALSFVESYYSKNGDNIPGIAVGSGEGIVIFDSNRVSDGASFYETKSGSAVFIDDTTIQRYKDNCVDTYVEVKNTKDLLGVSHLTLNAVCKYGDNNAYTLAREFTVGGTSTMEDNAFTGTINYQTTNQTRYVRFHVRATTALDSAPFFYMWYNQISPPQGSSNGTYNAYGQSSIVNKLTFNRKYGKVQNGSWGSSGPAGDCAMSYEGNGWYVTQKTFNLDRHLHFVNGIITKTGANRDAGDDQQSWEFFGLPIPKESELGAAEGIDIYFELNQNRIKDMKGTVGSSDAFTEKYRSYSSYGAVGQINEFVKYCGSWYTVYTKTETAIVHYREAGVTDDSAGPGGSFTYEGYGWWRDWSHNLNDSVFGYPYSMGDVIAHNDYGKERILELFVCAYRDPFTGQITDTGAFGNEEDANEWLIKHNDLAAGDYLEVNVRGIGQPVDAEVPTYIEYTADIYEQTEKVPTFSDATLTIDPTSADEEPEAATLEGKGDAIDYQDVSVNTTLGTYFYVSGDMNSWPSEDGGTWGSLSDGLYLDGETGKYFREYEDITPGHELKFWIIQRPSNANGNSAVERYLNETYSYYKSGWGGGWKYVYNYTNYWGDPLNSAEDYKYTFTPLSDKIRIWFDTDTETVEVEDIGEIAETVKTYSVIGWMNDWGKSQDGITSETSRYELTRKMEMYSDVEGIQTYSDGTLVVQTGKEYRFKIAERDIDVNEGDVDWNRVYGVDGQTTGLESGDDDETAILIKPEDSLDGKIHKYIVSIMFDPETKIPTYTLTETSDIESFYVVGEFNGWNSDNAEDYLIENAKSYALTEAGADKNSITYTYRLLDLQEAGDYEIKVIGSSAEIVSDDEETNGKINYDISWGDCKSRDDGDPENYLVTQGAEAPSLKYELGERAYVMVNFTYYKNDSTRSEVSITVIPAPDLAAVKKVYVGFHNAQLKNVNDHSKDSQFTTPWEKVYVTYYTEETGFNCFLCKQQADDDSTPDTDESTNWWYYIPEDAEYVYFSNKKTNIFTDFHSTEFEYSDSIKNAVFKGSESTIFFPIKPEKDDEERTRWTVGDSKLYNEYVNRVTTVNAPSSSDAGKMAYYGSTQCNYYDAPFVNVLNMLVTGTPKPTQRYMFSSFPYTNFDYNGRRYSFGNNIVSYQGENYYYTPVSGDSSLLVVQNIYNKGHYGENGTNKSMWGFLYEDQMSLEMNSGSTGCDSNYIDDSGYGMANTYSNWGSSNWQRLHEHLYLNDRAGGVFVSDTTYRDGSSSPFNYGGYTPSWYTYRIPVSSEITIKNIKGILTSSTKIINNNTVSFKVVKESANVNRPIYIYKPASGDTQSFTYNINQGVVDSYTESTNNVKVSVYYDNTDGWSKVQLCAYSPIKAPQYFTLSKDGTNADNPNLYQFTFKEGEYSHFIFFESNRCDATGLKDAEHKTATLYLTGEELGETDDKYLTTFSGMDTRTTRTLARGEATSFTWYMHPRFSVMHAYLDIDSVAQLLQIPKMYKYNATQGTYTYSSGDSNMLTMSGLMNKKTTLKNAYYNGNAGSGKWTTTSTSVSEYNGLLDAATEFMNAVREARIYCSDDIEKAPANSTGWTGYDPDQCMVFLEGEQIADSAFEYTGAWVNGLKNVYKRIMLTSYHETNSSGSATKTVNNNNACIWNHTELQNVDTMYQYAADLRLWLSNPQATLKRDAVRIIIDDGRKTNRGVTRGGWGTNKLNLYIKSTDSMGNTVWEPFSSEVCSTTQTNFYAFVFMAKEGSRLNGATYTVASTPPVNDVADGYPVQTCECFRGGTYRYTTGYLGDPEHNNETFKPDDTTETKLYTGTEITQTTSDKVSPTSELNQFISLNPDKPTFNLYFKYDTTITGGGVHYTIFAGNYEISEATYPNFKTDVPGHTGIDLYTEGAKTFFTTPETYKMVSAKRYQPWSSNRVNSSKPLDLMVSEITKSDNIKATAPGQRVSFRFNGEKDNDKLMILQDIYLQGGSVVIACNEMDFSASGNCGFTADTKSIIFLTDTVVTNAAGEQFTIAHGEYVFDETGGKTTKANFKNTTNDPSNAKDWRSNFKLVSLKGNELKGGKYVAD